MSSAAEILYDIPPGFHFEPKDDELVQLYLLPRVRGKPDLFPGLIVEDDTAANTPPWELFDRHGRSHAVPAFFFVRTNGAARPHRRCHGGGTWKSQKCEREDASHEMVVDGEKIKWKRHNLNLHMPMGAGKKGSGSSGWVMHEYSITDQPALKICRISFSGFGQKRKRVPDGYDGEPATQRPRVDADNSALAASGSGTTTFDQGFGTAPHASQHQQPILQGTSDEVIAAEMTYAQEPTWEFQAEQVRQTMNASAPQEFQPPSSWTTTFSQESASLAQDGAVHAYEGFQHVAAMVDEMTGGADLFFKQVPLMDQSSCGVPNIGDTDVVHWEGIDFSFSYYDSSMC